MKNIATNRRATFDYEILERFEAGIALLGSEVKSMREGKANLQDAYATINDGQANLIGAYVAPYSFSREGGHDPTRTRRLLMHRREIDRIAGKLAEKGLTLVPMKLYFKEGKVKVEIGLGRGKRTIDKRQSIKEREQKREMERATRRAR
jgi:SsrA-binding protein